MNEPMTAKELNERYEQLSKEAQESLLKLIAPLLQELIQRFQKLQKEKKQ